MVVTGVYGNRAITEVIMSEISLDKVKTVIPNIDTMYQDVIQIIEPTT